MESGELSKSEISCPIESHFYTASHNKTIDQFCNKRAIYEPVEDLKLLSLSNHIFGSFFEQMLPLISTNVSMGCFCELQDVGIRAWYFPVYMLYSYRYSQQRYTSRHIQLPPMIYRDKLKCPDRVTQALSCLSEMTASSIWVAIFLVLLDFIVGSSRGKVKKDYQRLHLHEHVVTTPGQTSQLNQKYRFIEKIPSPVRLVKLDLLCAEEERRMEMMNHLAYSRPTS